MKNKLIVFFIFLSVVINLLSFHNAQDWGDDFAGYVIQAKTIASGSFSALETNLQKTDYILNYPWGFPLLLSPVIGSFQTHLIAIKLYIFVFFLLSLIVTFFLLRKDKDHALVTLLLFSVCPYFWIFKNYILADFPNLFFVLLSLFLANRIVVNRKLLINEYISYLLMGICVFIGYTIRNQSLVLLPVIALVQLILYRREFRPKTVLLLIIPALTVIALSFIFSTLIPVKQVSYSEQYQNLDLWKTIWNNLFYYINVWKELFTLSFVIKEFNDVFTGFIITFAVIGLFSQFRRHFLFGIFFLASISILLISPFYQGVRYLIPSVPFFLYFFVIGLRDTAYKLSAPGRTGAIAYYGIVLAIAGLSLMTTAYYSYQQSTWEIEGPYKKTSVAAFDFVRKNSKPDEIMAFWKPRAMLLYTSRNTVVPLSYERCLEKKVKFFIFYKNAYDQIPIETISSHSENISEVYRNDEYVILKFLNSGS